MALPVLDATFASSADLPRRQMLAKWLVNLSYAGSVEDYYTLPEHYLWAKIAVAAGAPRGEADYISLPKNYVWSDIYNAVAGLIPPSSVLVSGAGSAVNGTYTYREDANGKPAYNLLGEATDPFAYRIQWDGNDRWGLIEIDDPAYELVEDTAFPWQGTWSISNGDSPAPALTEIPQPTPNHTDWSEKQALGHIAAAYRGDTANPEALSTYINWPWRYQVASIITALAVDSNAQSFITASGATDVEGIDRFVKGIKALGLWNSMVCWPLRSSQNAGTGTTAYSLGGLGTFNGTMVNGPTWGTSGITFVNASSQHILMGSQVFTNSDYTMFAAFKLTDVATTNLLAFALTWGSGGFFGVSSNGATTDRHGVWSNTGAFPGSRLSASGVSTVMHTAAITANASEFRFFTNGASFDSGVGNYQIITGTGKTVIGGANNSGASIIGHFNGEIAFAFAASQHLSAANVAALNNLYKSTLGTGLGLS